MNNPPLPFLERTPASGVSENAPIVILLHGRGAEAKTIFSIEGLLDPRLHVLAITGLYDSAIKGQEWFRPREKIPGEIHNARQFDESERVLTENIEYHFERLGIDRSRVFFWGFSQGAAMALILGLRGRIKAKGVIPMAGFLPTPVRDWSEWDKNAKYLLMHGTSDEVLPVESSKDAVAFLESKGIDAQYHEYKGRHKMTMDSIRHANEWIKQLAGLD